MPSGSPNVKDAWADPDDSVFLIDQLPEANQPTPVVPSPFQSPVTGRPFPFPNVKS
jgi:hypothetical protein